MDKVKEYERHCANIRNAKSTIGAKNPRQKSKHLKKKESNPLKKIEVKIIF